jgi:hypothetical protein
MGSRVELHNELLDFLPNVYFQPPSNIQMLYPCIVYSKTDKYREFSNNDIYVSKQGYTIVVIEKVPESNIANDIEKHFEYCTINQYYTVDNLSHITLQLYY